MGAVERVLIIGGGIGGLVTATGYALRGVHVDLIEQKPDFSVRGVGLGQPANALRALRAIGVLEECLEGGFPFDRLRFCDRNGDVIVEHRFRLGDESLPAVNALPRTTLHEILVNAAKRAGVAIRLGTTATQWEDTGRTVEAKFSDGTSGSYDLLVAFDGNASSTRRRLFGEAYEPVSSGFAAWRVMVDRPADITTMEFYQGLGGKTGVMPLSQDKMYLFHICPEPVGVRYDPSDFLSLFRERTKEYGGRIGEVIATLDETHEIVYSPLQPVNLPSPWYRGRVVVAGDAAHACPPHMTQGAGMAMEDGLVLVECTTTEAPVDVQLATFMERRFDRVRYVQQFAGAMLADEQAITTEEELERAVEEMRISLDERMTRGDERMNQEVLDPSWATISAAAGGSRA